MLDTNSEDPLNRVFFQGGPVKPGPTQAQEAGVLPSEVQKGQKPAHNLAHDGGDGRAGDAPAQQPHQHPVQDHVHDPGGHGDVQAQLGLFGGDEEAVELELEHEGRKPQEHDPPVEHAVVRHGQVCAQQQRHRPNDQHACHGDDHARDQGHIDQQREHLIGLFPVLLPQEFADKGAAAGPQHEAQGAQDHEEGHDEVHGGEGGLAHEVGHEEPVHHPVDGGEHHHQYGRQREPQQPPGVEMIRKLDIHRSSPQKTSKAYRDDSTLSGECQGDAGPCFHSGQSEIRLKGFFGFFTLFLRSARYAIAIEANDTTKECMKNDPGKTLSRHGHDQHHHLI